MVAAHFVVIVLIALLSTTPHAAAFVNQNEVAWLSLSLPSLFSHKLSSSQSNVLSSGQCTLLSSG